MSVVRSRWLLAGVVAILVGAGLAVALRGSPAAAASSAPGSFTPLNTPVRLLDTRSGLGAAKRPVAPDATVVLQVEGRGGGLPASGVGAVVVNVTVTGSTSSGNITVWDGGTLPNASNLNFVRAQTIANLVTTRVSASGSISLHNGSPGTVQLVADGSGYYVGGSATENGMFTPLTPDRLLDTRNGIGAPKAALGAAQELRLQVDGVAGSGVPATGVAAVVLNVTVTAPTGSGYITVWGDGPHPAASSLNFVRGQTVPNLVVAPVDSAGKVEFFNGSGGTVQLVADVSGYYLAGGPLQAGGLAPVPPTRLLDTRTGTGGPKAALATGATRTLSVAGKAWVLPSGVSAVVLNVTATAPTAAGYVTVWGSGTRPPTSNLNFLRGQTVPNLVVAPVASAGTVSFYNGSHGTVQLIADIAGFVLGADRTPAPPTAATGRYVRDITDGGFTDVNTMHDEGCADATDGAGPSLHLLHIGAQSQHPPLSAATPGVALSGFGEGATPRLTYPQLVTALDGYLDGYVSCHTGTANATVAIGTNNDGDWSTYTATMKGTDWATQVIEPLRAHVASSSWLSVDGADDIEAGFASSEADAETWVTNFFAHTSANLVQDGSADNCPFAFQAGGSVSCGPVTDDNGVTNKVWTQAQYVRLEHGLAPPGQAIIPLPQVYIPLQAWQWANIVRASNGQLTVPAVLTEHAADGTEFTAPQGWGQMWDALSTAAHPSAPTMSVDLRADAPAAAAARAQLNPRATLPQG